MVAHRAVVLSFLLFFGCKEQADPPASPQAVRRANSMAARIIREEGLLSDWRRAYRALPCADCPARKDVTDILVSRGWQGEDCLWYKAEDKEVYIVYVLCGTSSAFIIAKRVSDGVSAVSVPQAFFELFGTQDLWVK